jgi:hypothetical protein
MAVCGFRALTIAGLFAANQWLKFNEAKHEYDAQLR